MDSGGVGFCIYNNCLLLKGLSVGLQHYKTNTITRLVSNGCTIFPLIPRKKSLESIKSLKKNAMQFY